MNCTEAVAALVASLESGAEMSDEQRQHIRTCERCHELLDSAKQFQTLLAGNGIEPPPIDPALAAAEEEVRRRFERRAIGICAGVLLILAAAVASMLAGSGSVGLMEAVILSVVALLFGLPVFLIWKFARRSNGGKPSLYKRLKKGRVLAGVCLGLAETTRLNVSLIRSVFALLLIFKGAGFWLYLILHLAMPVHPEDRQYMLRFKVRRWFQRRMGHAKDYAG